MAKRISELGSATPQDADNFAIERGAQAPNWKISFEALRTWLNTYFAPASHPAETNNPHNVTAAQAGADPAGSAAAVQGNLDAHEGNFLNPHNVTALQTGADPAGSAQAVQNNLDSHEGEANPHGTTASDVGAYSTTESDARYGVKQAEVPAGGTIGQVLEKIGAGDYAMDWRTPTPGGGGEANTQTNLGGGVEVGLPKDGVDLPLRTLISGDGSVSITPVGQTVDLRATGEGGGEANEGLNLGGGVGVYEDKQGINLRFNSFSAAQFSESGNLISIPGGVFDPAGSAAVVQANLDTHTGNADIHRTQAADDARYAQLAEENTFLADQFINGSLILSEKTALQPVSLNIAQEPHDATATMVFSGSASNLILRSADAVVGGGATDGLSLGINVNPAAVTWNLLDPENVITYPNLLVLNDDGTLKINAVTTIDAGTDYSAGDTGLQLTNTVPDSDAVMSITETTYSAARQALILASCNGIAGMSLRSADGPSGTGSTGAWMDFGVQSNGLYVFDRGVDDGLPSGNTHMYISDDGRVRFGNPAGGTPANAGEVNATALLVQGVRVAPARHVPLSFTWVPVMDGSEVFPGSYISLAAGETKRMTRLQARIESGTSVDVQVLVNGGPAAGFTATVTPAGIDITPAAFGFSDGDFVSLAVSAPLGDPAVLSCTAQVESFGATPP